MSEKPLRNSGDLDDIDSSWDDDESGEVPRDLAIPDLEIGNRETAIPEVAPDEYVRRAMAGTAEAESEEKSGVQEREQPSKPTTPTAGIALDLPPLVTPDPPSAEASLDLTIDDPGRGTYDDLSLELPSGEAPDPMQLSAEPASSSLDLELDLETPVAPPAADNALGDLRARYAAGDFAGALTLAEALLEDDPNHADARRYAQSCRDVLMQMYTARLGPLDQVVSVAVPQDQVRWLSLDHRAGFLLSLVDGSSTIDEILDISGMVRLDALRIMFQLLEQQVIALESRSG